MTSLKKREHVRFNVQWRAAVFLPGQGTEKAVPAEVDNISLGGAAVFTDAALRVGLVYRVAMAIPTFDRSGVKYFEGHYRVVSSFFTGGRSRVSLKKEQMNESSSQTLLWFLREEANRLEWVFSKTTGRYEFVKESY